MPEDVMSLFEEYVAGYERGDRPDLRALLARAGEEGGEELATLVDAWLQVAPAPDPDEEAIAVAQAWITGDPPLLELRRRRRLTRAGVVDAIMARFRIDSAKRGRVERYYHEVETGQRTPADEGLLAALSELLGPRVRELVAWRGPELPDAAFYRERGQKPLPAPPAAMSTEQPASPSFEPAEPDDVDRLFRGR